MISKGISANIDSLRADLEARDVRDQNRSVAPLKPAEDAGAAGQLGALDRSFGEAVLKACKIADPSRSRRAKARKSKARALPPVPLNSEGTPEQRIDNLTRG